MINDKLVKIIILPLIFLLFLPTTKATHMVGGDFTYRCLGDGYFEITLTIRRDCFNGDPEAFFDDEAIITVFDQYGQLISEINRVGQYRLKYMGVDTLDEFLDVQCGIVGEKVCVEQATYRDTVYLPRPRKGKVHQLIYQRCCRNETLENIKAPLESGNSYKIEIDEYAYDECNDAPAFKAWPPVYICANAPLEFDHSAYETDGDSLVYKLYDPFMGGTFERPRPTLPKHYKPLGRRVQWADGYSLDNMLGSGVPLTIDSKTGLLTVTPGTLGQFLVGVMVEEYRNGELLSVVRRDFEFNVRECVPAPVPDFESITSLCGAEESGTIVFTNKSDMTDTIEWHFYLHSTGETSKYTEDVVSYRYTLPESGKDTLDVTLSAYQELADCSKEITKTVYLIRDELKADFDVTVNECYTDSLEITLNLKDKFEELNPLYTWKSSEWTLYFDDEILKASGQIVSIVVPKEASVRIKLFVDTEENCQIEYEKVVPLEFAILEFISEPLVNCRGDKDRIIKNPNSDWTYTWEPETGLDFSLDPVGKSNPLVSLDSDLTYNVTVTDGVCSDTGSVLVVVRDYFDLSILGPDTTCNKEVLLQAAGFESNDSIIEFEWSDNVDFTNIIHTGKEFATDDLNTGENKFYLRVKEGTGCANNIDSINVLSEAIVLDYDKEINYCTNSNAKIEIIKIKPDYDLSIHWEDSPLIVSSQDSLVLIIYTEEVGEHELIFTATTNFGCELVDTIKVIANEGPQLILENEINCNSYEMCFKVSGGNTVDYNWDFGKANDDSDKSTDKEPCFDYQEPGVYNVSVEVLVEECGGVAYLTKEVIVPEIINLDVDSEEITYCSGEELELFVSKNATADVKWYKGDDLVGEGDKVFYTPSGEEETITIVGYDIYGCTDTIELTLIPYQFEIDFQDPGVRCSGDTLQLEIINNSGANLSYEWQGENIIDGNNSATPTVVVVEDTQFEVTVTDLDNNCDSTFLFTIEVSDIDVGIETDIEAELVITNSGTVTVINVPDNSTILWSTGESDVETIIISAESVEESPEERTYCVTVTDEYGCSDEECITITVVDPPCNEEDIYIPNAFSPNGDNVNDVFRLRGKYIRSVEMRIYDRWGELLFEESGDENVSWDGTFRGEELPPDAYTYRVFVQCDDTDNWEQVGNVSIIK